MDQLDKSIQECTRLRGVLEELRFDFSREGRLQYYDVMYAMVEKQHNIHTRLLLLGDAESRMIAEDMEYVAKEMMGKPDDVSLSDYFNYLKDDIANTISEL